MPPKSRAARRLMPNNRSPDKSGRKRTRKEPDAAKNRLDEDRSCSSSCPRHRSRYPSRKRRSVVPDSLEAEHTPGWAKKLLEAHNKSEERLQRLESEVKSRPRSDTPGRANSPQPERQHAPLGMRYMTGRRENCDIVYLLWLQKQNLFLLVIICPSPLCPRAPPRGRCTHAILIDPGIE